MVEWYFVAMMVVATWVGAYGALYFKKGAQELKGSLIKKLTNRKVWLGLLLYGIASAISLIPMKFSDAHIIYPMTSMSYIWVAILSKTQLKEDLNKYKIMGIIIIILGIFLLAK